MKKAEFKFELGDKVIHICGGNHNVFVVIARYFEESINGVTENYFISGYEMGQVIRQRVYVEELKIESHGKSN